MEFKKIIINNKKIKYAVLIIILIVISIYFFLPKTIITRINDDVFQCRCVGITVQGDSFTKNCIGNTYNCTNWHPVGGVRTNYEDKSTIMELK